MEYKQAWEEYKETIQSSIYMQKLSLKEDEKIFKAGFDKALEKIHFDWNTPDDFSAKKI